MLLVGDDRVFVAGNRRARELLQVSPEVLRTLRIDDVAADQEAFEERWATFRKVGSDAGSLVLRAQDGSEHEVEVRARADYEPGRHLAILRPVEEPRARDGGRLSAREREVLRLLAAGAHASEVAETLFLSLAPVATHARH